MNADGVTFVIPNWNHELVLPRAIGSALRAVEVLGNQEIPGEVLVVDDGSRDGSVVLLRQLEALYSPRGLRVIQHRANCGLAQARATGLSAAKYRYAFWLDADNDVIAENVPIFLRAIRETEAAAVYGNLMVHIENQLELASSESFMTSVFQANYIDTFSLCDIQQWQDADAVWHDPQCPTEDWERWLHLAASGRKIVHVPVVIGNYYRNTDSMVQDSAACVKYEKRIHRMYRQFPEARERTPLNTKHLRYHPDVGWL